MPSRSRSTDIFTVVVGLLFAVAMIAWVATIGTPETDEPASEWAEHFEDSGNRSLAIANGYIAVLAGIAFAATCVALRQRLTGGTPMSSMWGRLGVIMAAIAGAGMAAGGMAMATVAASVEIGEGPVPDGEFARQLEGLGFGMVLVWASLAAAAAIACLSAGTLREGVAPRWLGYLGYVVAVALLFAVFFIPLIAYPIWGVCVAVSSWPRGRQSESLPAAAS